MNPTELRMMWMSQYNPERITLEDAASLFGHTSVGLSVMDDMSQQPMMDLNPMMSIVGGDFSGQAAAAAAAALGVQPGTLIANPNNIYGLTPVNALQQQLLQQSAAAAVFQNYNEVMSGGANAGDISNGIGGVDDDDAANGSLTDPHTGNTLMSADDVQHQQVYDQIDDVYDDGSGGGTSGCGVVGISGLIPKQEIINIDDFVMMTDSNSYDDVEFMSATGNGRDPLQSGAVNIAASGLVDDNDILVPLNDLNAPQQQKFLNNLQSANGEENTAAMANNTSGNHHHHRTQRKTRKIEPVNRPGLVLKTPIAYKGNIDPSVIPIQKDGMAVCERCGAIGVKHTFYTKSRRFCSMACARGELYSLVVNNKITGSNQQAQQQLLLQQQQQQQQQQQGGQSNEVMDDQLQQQLQMQAQQEQHSNDVEQALRVSHIKNSNYRFRITDQSKITQIGAYGETLNNFAQHYNNNNAANGGVEMGEQNEHSSTTMDSDEATASSGAVVLDNSNVATATDTTTSTPKPLRMYRDVLPQDGLPQIPKYERLPAPCPQMEKIMSIRRRHYDPSHSFDWTPRLKKGNCYAAAVTSFPHAPGYEVWDNLGIDMKVEVENTDCDSQEFILPGQTPHSFWVATILSISGYKALMRYEGFDDASRDFWVNLCNAEVHAVGWCATRGKPLIPPRTIEKKYKDWKDFLVGRLSGARTLPSSFYNKINDSLQSRFRLGLNLECVDKDRISQVRLATVTKIVGKRLFLRYFDSDDGFWCHEDSPIIHPVGWATTVGHNLAAPQDYLERMLAGREAMIEVHEDDATIELFKMNFTFEEYYMEGKTVGFMEGMKLEAVDPLNLSSICAATVMAVLKFGYMMIRIDSYQPDASGADWFCYHEKSPCIFPVGFCASNNITLTPPNGYDVNSFTWEKYLRTTGSVAAGTHLFHRVVPDHGFEVGMSLECADLMDPRLVCVATIARVVGRLLKIHFDGWTDEYDQWLDCESPDIYPVGWCYLVNHKLEGPPQPAPTQTSKVTTKAKVQKKRKKKLPNTVHAGAVQALAAVNAAAATPAPKSNDGVKPRTIALKTNPHLPKLSIKLELKPEHHNSSFYEDNQDVEDGEDDDDEDDGEEVEYNGAEYDDETNTSTSQRSEQTTPLPGTVAPDMQLATTNENALLMPNSTAQAKLMQSKKTQITTTNATAAPPPSNGRKGTKYAGSTTSTNNKHIPRLLESTASADASNQDAINNDLIQPETWNFNDVSQFLRVNDCTAHCENFTRNKIDGKRLMQLTKDEVINLLGMKVGPALKIFDLIQQLKCKINPGKARLNKNNKSGYL